MLEGRTDTGLASNTLQNSNPAGKLQTRRKHWHKERIEAQETYSVSSALRVSTGRRSGEWLQASGSTEPWSDSSRSATAVMWTSAVPLWYLQPRAPPRQGCVTFAWGGCRPAAGMQLLLKGIPGDVQGRQASC